MLLRRDLHVRNALKHLCGIGRVDVGLGRPRQDSWFISTRLLPNLFRQLFDMWYRAVQSDECRARIHRHAVPLFEAIGSSRGADATHRLSRHCGCRIGLWKTRSSPTGAEVSGFCTVRVNACWNVSAESLITKPSMIPIIAKPVRNPAGLLRSIVSHSAECETVQKKYRPVFGHKEVVLVLLHPASVFSSEHTADSQKSVSPCSVRATGLFREWDRRLC